MGAGSLSSSAVLGTPSVSNGTQATLTFAAPSPSGTWTTTGISEVTADRPLFVLTDSVPTGGTITRTLIGTYRSASLSSGSLIVTVDLHPYGTSNSDPNWKYAGVVHQGSTSISVTFPAGWLTDGNGNTTASATAAAVTNGSTLGYPKAPAQFAIFPCQRQTGQFYVDVVAGHMHGIASVAVTLTDSASFSQTLTQTSRTWVANSGSLGKGSGYYAYRFSFNATNRGDSSAFAAGVANLDLTVTPNIGDSSSIRKTATGVSPPATPTTAAVAGGALASQGTLYARVTYQTANGETYQSASATGVVVGASNLLQVTSPGATAGATGWNVYVGSSRGYETKQNFSPLTIGTNWTEPTTGLTGGDWQPFQWTVYLDPAGTALPPIYAAVNTNSNISGTVAGTFANNEIITQATSGATAVVTGNQSASPIMVSGIIGTPDATNTWSGASGTITSPSLPVALGVDATGAASTNETTARSTPFATLLGAGKALATARNTNPNGYGVLMDGCVIVYEAGTAKFVDGTGSAATLNVPVLIRPATGVAAGGVVFNTWANSGSGFNGATMVQIQNCAISPAAGVSTYILTTKSLIGNTTIGSVLILDGVTMTGKGSTDNNSYFYSVGAGNWGRSFVRNSSIQHHRGGFTNDQLLIGCYVNDVSQNGLQNNHTVLDAWVTNVNAQSTGHHTDLHITSFTPVSNFVHQGIYGTQNVTPEGWFINSVTISDVFLEGIVFSGSSVQQGIKFSAGQAANTVTNLVVENCTFPSGVLFTGNDTFSTTCVYTLFSIRNSYLGNFADTGISQGSSQTGLVPWSSFDHVGYLSASATTPGSNIVVTSSTTGLFTNPTTGIENWMPVANSAIDKQVPLVSRQITYDTAGVQFADPGPMGALAAAGGGGNGVAAISIEIGIDL